MRFDVIIGNPPYQKKDGGHGASAVPLYHHFINVSKKISPKYIVMIVPSRWFSGGRGLGEFRKEMLNDKRIGVIHDFPNSKDCFPEVDIAGGVCYFWWYSEKTSTPCLFVTHKDNEITKDKRDLSQFVSLVREEECFNVLKKILDKTDCQFSDGVKSASYFGLRTNFTRELKNTSGLNIIKECDSDYKVYAILNKEEIQYYLPHDCCNLKNKQNISKWKLCAKESNQKNDWLHTFIVEPNSITTESYVVLGLYDTEQQVKNVYLYSQTNFFQFLLNLKKIDHHTTSKVYEYIPMQDFNIEWSDDMLFDIYGLLESEKKVISRFSPTLSITDEKQD